MFAQLVLLHLLSLLFDLNPAAPAAAGGPVVWTASGTTRIPQDAVPGAGAAVRLWAAKGEYETFQVAVSAPAGGLTNVQVTVSDLTGPAGHSIPKTAFALYREQYVRITQGSSDPGGTNRPHGAGLYADGLIPFIDPETGLPPAPALLKASPFSVAGNLTQPVWVDLFVPRDTPAGTYSGALALQSDQGSAAVPVTLGVWNFELPLQPSLKSSFPIYSADGEVLANQKVLLRHKLMPRIVHPADAPMLMRDYGLNITSLWIWTGAKYGNCVLPATPAVSALVADASQNPPGLPLYVHSADEIDSCTQLFPALKQWAQAIHSAGIKNLVSAAPVAALRDDGSSTGRSVADIWALLPKLLTGNAADVAAAEQKGDELWSYNALAQDTYSPKWLLDYDPINYRIQAGFLNEQQGLKGLLYWCVNNWGADPWNNADYSENGKPFPGEGMLVYPGAQVGLKGFAPSIRLKMLREGVEDFEYVEILKRAGYGAWALAQVRTVAPDWAHWNQDPQALETVRLLLGQGIEAIAASHSLDGGSLIRPVPPGASRVRNGRGIDRSFKK